MESISKDEYAFSKYYKDKNFTLNYGNTMFNCLKDEEEFSSFCLHKIFHNESYRGKRIIDVGCGPTINKMAAASTYFSEIVLSDYTEHNRQVIQKWLRNEPPTENLDRTLKMEAQLQGYGNIEEGINEIKLRLREKIKEVVHCDILKEDILPSSVGKFHVLFSSYCLEGACTTLDSYKKALKNLSKYIQPNGELVMVTMFENSSYEVKGYETIPSLRLNEGFVNDALKELGFNKKHWFYIENSNNNFISFRGIAVLSATKNS